MLSPTFCLTIVLFAAQPAPTTAPTTLPATTPATQPGPAAAARQAEAVNAEQILARFIDATGGKENQAKVRHRVHTGTMSVEGAPVEITGEVELIMDFSRRFKLTTELGSLGAIERVATPDVGWTRDPFAGVQIMPDAERDATLHGMTSNALTDPTTLYDAIEYVGVEPVKAIDAEAHRLKMTLPSGRSREQWYAVETGLLVQQLDEVPTPLGMAKEVTVFGEWKDVTAADGSFTVKTPFVISKDSGGGQVVTITLTDAEINGELPEDVFAIPADVATKAGLD